MKIAHHVARVLLGLIFLAAGLSGFFLIRSGPPSMPGLAGQFQAVFFASRMVLFVDGVMALCGLAFLLDRYVALAIVTSAAIIFNIAVFHLTMQPLGLPAPIVLFVLWILVALPLRERLMPLLAMRHERKRS